MAVDSVPLKKFRHFLKDNGLKHIRTKGGHEVWSRADLGRPIILQTHIDPVPGFIVLRNLKTMGSSKKELLDYLGN